MSLFGDFADDPPSSQSKPNVSKTSLFDEEPSSHNRNSSSLFADDGAGDDSPWGMPTPKKAGRAQLVKNLLPGTNVPELYVDIFDDLAAEGNKQGNGISLDGAKKVLEGSGLASDVKSRILGLVLPAGEEGALQNGVGRSESNVLLALVALAQEGEDVGLDAVDDRKRSMLNMLL
jgi:sorting nexin-8